MPKRKPTFYNTFEDKKELVLSTRSDKLGNVFHYVQYYNADGSSDYVRFSHLSSAMDFINSNFS